MKTAIDVTALFSACTYVSERTGNGMTCIELRGLYLLERLWEIDLEGAHNATPKIVRNDSDASGLDFDFELGISIELEFEQDDDDWIVVPEQVIVWNGNQYKLGMHTTDGIWFTQRLG